MTRHGMISQVFDELDSKPWLPEELVLKLEGISHCLVNSVPTTISLTPHIRWVSDRANCSSIVSLLDSAVRFFSNNQKSVVQVDETWVSGGSFPAIYCALVDGIDSPRFITESGAPQGVMFSIGAYKPGMRYETWATEEEHAMRVASRRIAARRNEQRRSAQELIRVVLKTFNEHHFKQQLAGAADDQRADAEFHMGSRPRSGESYSAADIELMLAALFALESPELMSFIEVLRQQQRGL